MSFSKSELKIFENIDNKFIQMWKTKVLTEIQKNKQVFQEYECDTYWHICTLFTDVVGFIFRERTLFLKLSSFKNNNPNLTQNQMSKVYVKMWLEEVRNIHSKMNTILENKKDDTGTFIKHSNVLTFESHSTNSPLTYLPYLPYLTENQQTTLVYPKEEFWKDSLPLTISGFKSLTKDILTKVEKSIEKNDFAPILLAYNVDIILFKTKYNVSEKNKNIEIRKILIQLFHKNFPLYNPLDYSTQIYQKGDIIYSKVIELIKMVTSKHLKNNNGNVKKTIRSIQKDDVFFSDVFKKLIESENEWRKSGTHKIIKQTKTKEMVK